MGRLVSGGRRWMGTALVLFAAVGAAVLAAPSLLAAQVNPNPGFEQTSEANPGLPSGWGVAGPSSALSLDSIEAGSGRFSLRVRTTEEDRPIGVGRSIPASQLHHTRVTVSGYIKTNGLFPGYAGLLLRFEGNEGPIFADDMAGRGATGTSDWTRFETSALVPKGADEITFGAMVPGVGTAWFDDVTLRTEVPVNVPSPTTPPSRLAEASPDDDPVAYVERALTLMEESSLVRASVNWDSLRATHLAAAREAEGADAAHSILRRALEDLGDGHSQFVSPATATARADPEAPGTGPTSPIVSERLADGIGYLRVPGFIGTSEIAATDFASELDHRIAVLDAGGTCGWIVDLRANPGGNMWPMLAGLWSLIGEGAVGAFRRPDGTETPWRIGQGRSLDTDLLRARVADPRASPNHEAPVAVLTGPGTASSGEAIAVSFRGRPNARSFGQASHGLSTSNASLPLADGAVLELTTAVFADRDGTTYGEAIPPDQPVPSAPDDVPVSRDPVVRSAAEWIGTRPDCR